MSPRHFPGYVLTAMQWVVLLLVLWAGWHFRRPDGPPWLSALGGVVMTCSLVPAVLGLFHLGRNISPWPHPHDSNRLVTHGIYRHLRHPLYASLISFAAGWALWSQSWAALLAGVLLFIVLRTKAGREEQFLLRRHPGYEEYTRSTGSFLPAWRKSGSANFDGKSGT